MTPDRVFERLRRMSELSANEASPMPRGVDMSPRAVAARLREMAELAELCHKLGTGRIHAPTDCHDGANHFSVMPQSTSDHHRPDSTTCGCAACRRWR